MIGNLHIVRYNAGKVVMMKDVDRDYCKGFIDKRHEEMPEGSYTTSLFKKGVNKMAQKVGEEAVETIIEATNGNDEKLVYESSDLLYHLIVLLTSKGLRIEDIAKELQMRHDPDWDKKRRVAKSKGENPHVDRHGETLQDFRLAPALLLHHSVAVAPPAGLLHHQIPGGFLDIIGERLVGLVLEIALETLSCHGLSSPSRSPPRAS